jgi:hypothetical protein
MRTLFVTFALLAGFAAVAEAQVPPQEPAPVYVSGGYLLGFRNPGGKTPSDRYWSWVQSGDFSIGGRLSEVWSVEASIGPRKPQSIPWHYSYDGYEQEILTSDRDTPILGLFRAFPWCESRACVQPVIGAGFTRHTTSSVVTAECSSRTTCTPLATPKNSSEAGPIKSFELTFVGGADAPFRVSKHLSIAPSFRLLLIRRRAQLTEYGVRGLIRDSGLVPTLGMTLTWHSR